MPTQRHGAPTKAAPEWHHVVLIPRCDGLRLPAVQRWRFLVPHGEGLFPLKTVVAAGYNIRFRLISRHSCSELWADMVRFCTHAVFILDRYTTHILLCEFCSARILSLRIPVLC